MYIEIDVNKYVQVCHMCLHICFNACIFVGMLKSTLSFSHNICTNL